jgi:hypothetical protein
MGALAAFVFCAAISLSPKGEATIDSVSDSTISARIREAASDSTKPILLSPIVISAKRIQPSDATWIPSSAGFLYPDDGAKLLLGDLRISSPLPASADLRLYGLPVDQTARDYIWEHRIGGPTTAVFGSRTKINPDVVQVELQPFLMSHQYRDTNGSLLLRPAFQSSHFNAISISSDAIERRATIWAVPSPIGSRTQLQVVTSLRQSDVAPFLKDAVPELRVIPRYLDSQTHVSFRDGNQTIEGFFLFGRERGDWREMSDTVETAVLENTRQDLAVLRYEHRLPHYSKVTAGVSWEGDHVDSEHLYGDFIEGTKSTSHIVNPRISYSVFHEAVTTWVSNFIVESEPGGSVWRNSADAGIEGRATRGWLTLEPSLAVQAFHGEATILHGVTARAHPAPLTLTAGYGTYADYFVFHDGIFGSVFDPGGAQAAQRANHYAASIQYQPKHPRWFELVRVTGVRKDLDVDLWGSREGVQVLSWDCLIARAGKPSWELACLANDVQTSSGPLVGMIPFSLRAGASCDTGRWFNVSVEANYRSGSIAENRMPGPHFGERYRLDPSNYLNTALTRTFKILDRPANLTLTVFNILAAAGGRAELTVDEYGRRYDAPCWGNLRLRYDLW